MAAHTIEQRAFIVLRLARLCSVPDILEAFAAEFRDTACTPADIAACDPQAPHYALLSPEDSDLFRRERERVLLDPGSAPAADKRVRLIYLNRELDKARARNAVGLMQSLLAQIALETGGAGSADVDAGGAGDLVTEVRYTLVDPPARDESAALSDKAPAA